MYNVQIPHKKHVVWRQIAILNYPSENKLIRKGDKDDRGSKMSLAVTAVDLYQKCVMRKKKGLKLKF